MSQEAEIGIFGGSGFYSFLEGVEEVRVETPYGPPSDTYFLGDVGGRRVAFLPRHGRSHTIPAHKVNYRANVWGMRKLGVTRIIGPCSCGSLRRDIEPGHFVVCDQFVDRTNGRADTFYDGPIATHVGCAEPYCPSLRARLAQTGRELGIPIHDGGTVVVIQGPRFSTRAESAWFSSAGWDVVNMTAYPEGYLARELEMCYANVSLVTDYDVGLHDDPSVSPVTAEMVMKVFSENISKLRELLLAVVPQLEPERSGCPCPTALTGARF